MRARRLLAAAVLAALVLVGLAPFDVAQATPSQATVPETATPQAVPATPGDPLVLAHYYIWFEPTSWNRAKIDFPAAGRYSSDQRSIMTEHVASAKSVGIDGFIVSWKSTEVLDPRLETLMEVAAEHDFKLAITFQGLDFNRDRLPPNRIGDDLDLFVERYADDDVFQIFDKPLVVWSGTWEYTREEIAAVTSARADHLNILASEKNLGGYARIADVVDGNLYYWSSVNPDTFPDYPTKLIEMGNAVRAQGGIWIAPAAPGFDARLVGGQTVVERAGGDTLRAQWQGATESVPDAIGIISWNEFSENTHIEPSQNFGSDALTTLADLTGAPRPAAIDFDSSAPAGPPEVESTLLRTVAMIGFVTVMLGSVAVVRHRQSGERAGRRLDPTGAA